MAWDDEDEDELEQEDAPKANKSLLDAFVGDLDESEGVEPVSADSDGEEGDTEGQEPTANFVRFYDDRTERPKLSNSEMMALAAIGLIAPVLGFKAGGKVGGYAGGAAAAKGIGDALKLEDEHYKDISKTKAINKSRILTQRELSATKGAGAGEKVKYQWLLTRNKAGEPVYTRVDRATGQPDRTLDLPAYKSEYYLRAPQGGSRTQSPVTDGDGIEMPSPEDAKTFDVPNTTPGAAPPYNYDKKGPQPKPSDVPSKLPEGVKDPESEPAAKKGGNYKPLSASEVNTSAERMLKETIADLEAQIPDERDLNSQPKQGESFNSAEDRAKEAQALKKQIIGDIAKAKDGLIGLQRDIEKETRGEARTKRLAEFQAKLREATQRERLGKSSGGKDGGKEGPGGGKPLSPVYVEKFGFGKTAVNELSLLGSKVAEKKNLFGPVLGRAGSANPYAKESQELQADLKRTAQTIGKYMEGGVLRKEDEVKYEKMLPIMSDTPDVAQYKLKEVEAMLRRKHEQDVSTLKAQGWDTTGLNIFDSEDARAIKSNLDVQKKQTIPPGKVIFEYEGTQALIPYDRIEYYMKKSGGKGKVIGGDE